MTLRNTGHDSITSRYRGRIEVGKGSSEGHINLSFSVRLGRPE